MILITYGADSHMPFTGQCVAMRDMGNGHTLCTTGVPQRRAVFKCSCSKRERFPTLDETTSSSSAHSIRRAPTRPQGSVAMLYVGATGFRSIDDDIIQAGRCPIRTRHCSL